MLIRAHVAQKEGGHSEKITEAVHSFHLQMQASQRSFVDATTKPLSLTLHRIHGTEHYRARAWTDSLFSTM